MFCVIAYDIGDNRRRTKIANLLENYGQRMQYSLFECYLRRRDYLILRDKLNELINLTTDRIFFYFIDDVHRKQIERIGGAAPLSDRKWTIV
ncbi:MAG: CRISPR-associated endonuclease Cas2 [Gemmatimonadetes bacterium]|nr:MAG: CRISPR-associated endonuclease Cas2 [Gemmatimonadota bacterium]